MLGCVFLIILLNKLDKCVVLDRTEERRILHQIVEKALECKASLMEIVNFTLAYTSKDLRVNSQKLCSTLKVKLNCVYSQFIAFTYLKEIGT